MKTGSHQQALIALINEHVVFSWDREEFSGGYQ
jgi:hypothetical protein